MSQPAAMPRLEAGLDGRARERGDRSTANIPISVSVPEAGASGAYGSVMSR